MCKAMDIASMAKSAANSTKSQRGHPHAFTHHPPYPEHLVGGILLSSHLDLTVLQFRFELPPPHVCADKI